MKLCDLLLFALLLISSLPGGNSGRKVKYRKKPFGLVTSPMMPVLNSATPNTITRRPGSVVPQRYYDVSLAQPTNNVDASPYKVNCADACSFHGEVLLLMFVLSQPNQVQRRMAIRDTWGARRNLPNLNMPLVFLVPDSSDFTAQLNVASEEELYHDMVQLQGQGSSANLTRSTVMAFHWARTFCSHANFVMIASDEVLVDTFKLAPFLQLQKQAAASGQRLILCDLVPCCRPAADKEHSYAGSSYPAHCSATAMVFPSSIVNRMHAVSVQTPIFTPHQVFIGVVAEKLGLSFDDNSALFGEAGSLHRLVSDQDYMQSPLMVSQVLEVRSMRHLWWKITDQHTSNPQRPLRTMSRGFRKENGRIDGKTVGSLLFPTGLVFNLILVVSVIGIFVFRKLRHTKQSS